MKRVELYTDGACSHNPGPGGWGAILVYTDRELELSGFVERTTNNRMELTAVIEGLSAIKQPCHVIVTSDSKYVIDSVKKGWLANWQTKNWINSRKQAVPNRDLWELLLPLLSLHKVEFIWIRGHTGHPYNERCDRLAVGGYAAYHS